MPSLTYTLDEGPLVGPAIPQQLTEEEQAELDAEAIIKRSESMKKKLEGGNEKKLERESWMTELPALRTVNIKGLNIEVFEKFRV